MTNSNHTVEETVLDRSVAQFFFEVGYGAAYAEALISNNMVPPFELTDDVVEAAWEVAGEAHEDPEEFDRYLALASHSTPAGEDVDPEAVIDIINVVTDLADADALDKAVPEVSRRIAALHVLARPASLPPSTHDELVEALTTCANTFWEYEYLHEAKGTEDGRKKAERNRELALMCEAALIRHRTR